MKTIFIILLITSAFVKLYPQDKHIVGTSYIMSDSTKYKIDILEKGDNVAYEALCYIYDYEFEKILPYSLILAEIYKNENTYLDSYLGLSAIIDKKENIDLKKKDILVSLALYYLKS